MLYFYKLHKPVFNLDRPEKINKFCVLLDSGSQCSYITQRACKKFALQSLGTKSVSIMTFGSRVEQLTDCALVTVGIELKNGMHLELKLLSVPHICEPIVNSAVALDQYPHLNSLELAADFELPNQIVPDVLLGSDQYWSLLTGEVIKGNTGPTALNTHLELDPFRSCTSERSPCVTFHICNTCITCRWNGFKQRSRERVTFLLEP